MTISDNGLPSLSSVTRVVVMVTDKNDERPQFLDLQYRVRVPRLPAADLQLGVFRVVAYDRDIGPNADIEYSIAGGNGRGKRGVENRFRIDSRTGMIYAEEQLERNGQYDIQVRSDHELLK